MKTAFTDLMKCEVPLIAAPMFLVSNEEMVIASAEAGAVGTFPALNYRPIEEYKSVLTRIKQRTKKPIGVNIIVNKSNTRQKEDLKIALDHGVEMFITSLGSPSEIIKEAHKNGSKVFCDVTNLEHAKKVQDLGADGVIAVASGAGGHAGPISPLVLIRWLKNELNIPIVAAGGIADGYQMAAALILGASAVSVGTRFIASTEAQVDHAYKQAIIESTPEDIVMTTKISGTPAAVINTDYIKKTGTDLNPILNWMKNNSYLKKYTVPLIHWLGMQALEGAATKATWKTVWSAGQSVGAIDEILTCREIIEKFQAEFDEAIKFKNI